MPDYSLVEPLCRELNITVAELLSGEVSHTPHIKSVEDGHMLKMMERVQALERQKQILTGIILLVMGIALLALSKVTEGSSVRDLMSGILLGLSVGEMLAGVFVVAATFRK